MSGFVFLFFVFLFLPQVGLSADLYAESYAFALVANGPEASPLSANRFADRMAKKTLEDLVKFKNIFAKVSEPPLSEVSTLELNARKDFVWELVEHPEYVLDPEIDSLKFRAEWKATQNLCDLHLFHVGQFSRLKFIREMLPFGEKGRKRFEQGLQIAFAPAPQGLGYLEKPWNRGRAISFAWALVKNPNADFTVVVEAFHFFTDAKANVTFAIAHVNDSREQWEQFKLQAQAVEAEEKAGGA